MPWKIRFTAIKDAGYTNLLSTFNGAEAYSYIFDGLSGYLDHALASPTLAAQASGATEWHINADEPSVIDYNTEYKPQDLYTSEPYRASDHDPVVIGLNLRSTFDASKEVDLAFDRIPETSEIDLFAGDMFTYYHCD
jgi:predicted extracellular nuclease